MPANGSGICIVSFDEQQKLPTPIRNITHEFFEEFSSCISFIEQQTKEDKAVVLITTTIEEESLQTFELLTAIEAIVILFPSGKDLETLPSKVIGIYPQNEPLLRSVSELLDTIDVQLAVKSLLFHRGKDGNDHFNFYFYHLWKNDTRDQNSTKKSLADYSRRLLGSNHQINEFETTYRSSNVLSWLDRHRHPFPYHLLLFNALRTHNEKTLSHARFFLNDLNKQMKPASSGMRW